MKAKIRGGRLRRWAGVFRRLPVHPQWLLGAREERDALRKAFASLSGIIVDIGCADRRALKYLPAGCTYVGMDYPGTVLRLYGTRPDAFGDARQLPFGDGSIDGVILKDVLEHINGPQMALRECARITRPGGSLVLWMPFMYPIHDAPDDYQRITAHGLKSYLTESGFEIVQSSGVLRPVGTAGLLASLALADACEQIAVRKRLLLPIVPLLVVLIGVINLSAYLLGLLPAGDFMPAFNRIVAVRRE